MRLPALQSIGRRVNEPKKVRVVDGKRIISHRTFLPPDDNISCDQLGVDDDAAAQLADRQLAPRALVGWAALNVDQDTRDLGPVAADPLPNNPFHVVINVDLPANDPERRDAAVEIANTLAKRAEFRDRP